MTTIARTIPRRRLNFLDAILVVASMALAFALVRAFLKSDSTIGMMEPQRTWVLAVGVSERFVCALMPGLLAIRLRRPRPGLRRLSRQPGAVACAAATAGMAAGGLVVLSLALFRSEHISSRDNYYWPLFEERIGTAVMVAWLALFITGRRRAEPSWIDRAGCALGVYWIVLAVLIRLSQMGFRWFPYIILY